MRDILGFNGDIQTVLCVGAHCDDIEIGCGGTLLRMAAAFPNANYVWAVFSGESERERESRAAMEALLPGVSRREFRIHAYRGSWFPSQYEQIKASFESLKNVMPDVIFSHFLHDRHQDHALLAELTWNTFRGHQVFEYEIPKFEGDLGQPNCYFPLTADLLDRKVRLLMDGFPSQRSRNWFTPETFRGLARIRGIECGAPGGYAEAFHVRKFCL
jgi:LmbE family N-acetylglucosaminyl deacetylase